VIKAAASKLGIPVQTVSTRQATNWLRSELIELQHFLIKVSFLGNKAIDILVLSRAKTRTGYTAGATFWCLEVFGVGNLWQVPVKSGADSAISFLRIRNSATFSHIVVRKRGHSDFVAVVTGLLAVLIARTIRDTDFAHWSELPSLV
jgi:hypothetical protein